MTDDAGMPSSLIDLPEPMAVLAGRVLPPGAMGDDPVRVVTGPDSGGEFPPESRLLLTHLQRPRLLGALTRELAALGAPETAVDELIDAGLLFVCRPGPLQLLAQQLAPVQIRIIVAPRPAPAARAGVFLPVDARRGVHLAPEVAAALFADAPLGQSVPSAASALGMPLERVWSGVFLRVVSVLQTGTGYLVVRAPR